jgi:hypothetical protein
MYPRAFLTYLDEVMSYEPSTEQATDLATIISDSASARSVMHILPRLGLPNQFALSSFSSPLSGIGCRSHQVDNLDPAMPTTPVSRAWHKNLSDVSAKRLDQFAEWSRHLLDFSAKRWDKLVEWSRHLMDFQAPTVQPEQNLAVGLVSFPVVLVTSTLGEKTALSS